MSSNAKKSILVLEDDDVCREVIRSVLHAAGFKVLCAREFDEAIRIVEHGEPIDVALVDVKMPPGTPHGVSFARMAQQRRPRLKIIFMSSSINLRDTLTIDDGEPFLYKPFAPQHLLSLLEREAAA